MHTVAVDCRPAVIIRRGCTSGHRASSMSRSGVDSWLMLVRSGYAILQ